MHLLGLSPYDRTCPCHETCSCVAVRTWQRSIHPSEHVPVPELARLRRSILLLGLVQVLQRLLRDEVHALRVLPGPRHRHLLGLDPGLVPLRRPLALVRSVELLRRLVARGEPDPPDVDGVV